jgi:hypothetical protein
MQRSVPSGWPKIKGAVRRGIAWCATFLLLGLAGCEWANRSFLAPRGAQPPVTLTDADSAFGDHTPRGTSADGADPGAGAVPLPQGDALVVLSVMQVRVPKNAHAEAEKIWNHLREDALPAERVLLLRRNGVRVGLGQARFWEAIKAGIEGIEGHSAEQLDPVRLPLRYPLGLELDREPHDQTLFFVDGNGILSGATWTQSRNVLVVTCTLDPQHADRVLFSIVPEVRQRLPGLRWVRTPLGLGQEPRYDGRAYPAAGLTLGLAAGEYVVLAPSDTADVTGIVGGAFLASENAGTRYELYIFMKPEVVHGGRDR